MELYIETAEERAEKTEEERVSAGQRPLYVCFCFVEN